MRTPLLSVVRGRPSNVPRTRTRHDENLLGAGLMAGSMAAFVFNDTAIKVVTQTLPLSQAILMRGAVVTVVLWLVARRDPAFAWRPAAARDRWLLALRTVAEVASTLLYLVALQFMSIGRLSAVMQSVPILMMLAAAVVFREKLGWRRLLAAAVGLVGVLLILRPGTDAFDTTALLAVGAALLIVVRDLASRGFSPAARSSTIALYAALAVTLSAPLVGGVQDWRWPTGAEFLWLSVSVSFLSVAYLSAVASMRVGEVGFVSPFRYTSLIFAFLLDLAIFGVWPAGWTWAGAALVVGAGLYTIWRESRLRSG